MRVNAPVAASVLQSFLAGFCGPRWDNLDKRYWTSQQRLTDQQIYGTGSVTNNARTFLLNPDFGEYRLQLKKCPGATCDAPGNLTPEAGLPRVIAVLLGHAFYF